MTTQRKRCAFCGRDDRKITKEHAWPNWTKTCLPALSDHVHSLRIELHRAAGVAQWNATDGDMGVTINQICKPCNNGWMHDLEESVRPFLCSMIREGSAITLDAIQATRLATWAYKTMLVFDLIAPIESRRFAGSEYEFLYRNRQPPVAGLATWLASYSGSMLGTATDRGLTLGAGTALSGNAIVTTFSIGRLGFQNVFFEAAHRLPPPGFFIPQIDGLWTDRLRLLWPIIDPTGRGIFALNWPPPSVLDDGAMIALRNRWDLAAQ